MEKRENNLEKRKNARNIRMILPIYVFTIVFVTGPLLYMLALSFASPNEGYGVVWKFTFDNYKKLLEPVYVQTFLQSLKLACISTVFICLFGYPFGYFMAKLGDKWKKRTMLVFMLPFWLNSLIRLYGWVILFQKKGIINTFLQKIGVIQKPIGILYTYPAVVVGMIYVLLPFMVLSVYSSAEKLDWSYMEAARDLGASRMRAFFGIAFPLTLPGVLSGIILTFIPSMGLFFIADILGGNKIVLVGSIIEEQMTRAGNWPLAASMAVILLLLTSVMIFICKRVFRVRE